MSPWITVCGCVVADVVRQPPGIRRAAQRPTAAAPLRVSGLEVAADFREAAPFEAFWPAATRATGGRRRRFPLQVEPCSTASCSRLSATWSGVKGLCVVRKVPPSATMSSVMMTPCWAEPLCRRTGSARAHADNRLEITVEGRLGDTDALREPSGLAEIALQTEGRCTGLSEGRRQSRYGTARWSTPWRPRVRAPRRRSEPRGSAGRARPGATPATVPPPACPEPQASLGGLHRTRRLRR